MVTAPQQATSHLFFSLGLGVPINSPNTPTSPLIVFTFEQHFEKHIMAQNSHMLSVSFGDGNMHSGNISNSFNTGMSDEAAQIARWLSPLEPGNRHRAVSTDRFDGIGDWFLETREFREWRRSEDSAGKAVLFCSGNPGVGKTYLR